MFFLNKTLAVSQLRDTLLISKPRLMGGALLEALLTEGNNCFCLSTFMVLRNLFLELPPHPHRTEEILMRKLTGIQETHAYRLEKYPYLTEEFLGYFGLEEKRAVLDCKNLKLGNFNALVCIQIETDQSCLSHTVALLFKVGRYALFDPNAKTLSPKAFPNADIVTDLLVDLLDLNNKNGLYETRVEKVWYTAAPPPNPLIPNGHGVQSKTTQITAEQKPKNKKSKGWGWPVFS